MHLFAMAAIVVVLIMVACISEADEAAHYLGSCLLWLIRTALTIAVAVGAFLLLEHLLHH